MSEKYEQLVNRQFGSTAQAYVASTVHASGKDLEWVAKRAQETAPARALDMGTGGGHTAYTAAAYAKTVTASDLLPDMLEAVSCEAARRGIENLETQIAAAEDLPFPDAHFNFLTCRFSTHHWQNAQAGLCEARRVLAKGSPALFIDVIAPQGSAAADTHLQTLELLRDPSHVRDYALREWTSMLDRAGFHIRSCDVIRLRMDFTSWTARMQTPAAQIAAIRTVQQSCSEDVVTALEIEDNGSFTVDVAMIEAA
ncbi:methyltransferase domain-containing protein [Altererythrobacter indicus]|uniref:Methyltransferase domain-containing protein n=1 Tax=Altericroceibacterium indicum TaxID=374177 RepID=A0A845A5Y9_9SPHN|nr:class I SAM-dependent methyltransferase [Altericroceibacterium indicum]MXP24769.1 methyltransferase domain-containing protein [Altericroceibacterium indicum]